MWYKAISSSFVSFFIYFSDVADEGNCGSSLNTSCQTITYALKRASSFDELIIVMDGGQDEPMEYHLLQPILLTRNISFTSSQGRKFSPIIKTCHPTEERFAFIVKSKSDLIFTSFESIDFHNVFIINMVSNSLLKVVLYNCSVTLSPYIHTNINDNAMILMVNNNGKET